MLGKRLFDIRRALVVAFLRERGYDGVLLMRPDNVAMATGGRRSYIWEFSDVGSFSFFITRDGEAYYVGNNIEAPRAAEEELSGFDCSFKTFSWYEGSPARCVSENFKGLFASDDGSLGPRVHEDLALLRSLLSPIEVEKYRVLGKLSAEAMEATLAGVERGMPEDAVAARLVCEGNRRGLHVPVALVAADQRAERHRHPLPTIPAMLQEDRPTTRVSNYAMVVACFIREGLVTAFTRFKAVAPITEKLEEDYRRICAVEVSMQKATVPGATLGDVFAVCREAYPRFGFAPDEWKNHHQGGATGYAGRTCKGKPGERFPVLAPEWSDKVKAVLGETIPFSMAFAWNPSAPGVKSEDTFLVHPNGEQEIVTITPSIPRIDLEDLVADSAHIIKSAISR